MRRHARALVVVFSVSLGALSAEAQTPSSGAAPPDASPPALAVPASAPAPLAAPSVQAPPAVPAPSQRSRVSAQRSAAALAQASARDALERYRAEALYTRFSFWRGIELARAGAAVNLGYFGGNAEAVFAESPAALAEIDRFRTMRISGTVLYVAGVALLVTDLVLLSDRSELVVRYDANGEEELTTLSVALLLSGAALGITGGALVQASASYISSAAELYNADIARQLTSDAGRRLRSPTLRLRGTF